MKAFSQQSSLRRWRSPPRLAQTKKITVICTIPTLKALTEEVGGNRVDVVALARGDQDPHFVTHSGAHEEDAGCIALRRERLLARTLG